MKGKARVAGTVLFVALLLTGGAFMAGRLLGSGLIGAENNDAPMVTFSTKDGQQIKAEWVRSPELPKENPHVAGAFARCQDNSIFVDETEGGFALAKNEDDSFSVVNTTGVTTEVVVTSETGVYVDTTQEDLDGAYSDGKLYQQLEPGSVDEIRELSFVRAWGEERGDRLIADVLVYSRPPVISR